MRLNSHAAFAPEKQGEDMRRRRRAEVAWSLFKTVLSSTAPALGLGSLFSQPLSLAVGGAQERGNDDSLGCTRFLEHDDRNLQLYLYICMYDCLSMYMDIIMHGLLLDLYIWKG